MVLKEKCVKIKVNEDNMNYKKLDKSINELKNNSYLFQCVISDNHDVKTVISYLFIYCTKLLYFSIKNLLFQSDNLYFKKLTFLQKQDFIMDILNTIYTFQLKNKFLFKPGIAFDKEQSHHLTHKSILPFIIQYIDHEDKPFKTLPELVSVLNTYPLLSLTGALYGVAQNPTLFLLIYTAYLNNTTMKHILQSSKCPDIIHIFRNMYGLPNHFSEHDFEKLIKQIIPFFPMSKTTIQKHEIYEFVKGISDKKYIEKMEDQGINPNMHHFLFDLFFADVKSIAKCFLNNKPYLRLFRGHNESDKAEASSYVTVSPPTCPKIVDEKNVKVITAKQWFTLPKSSLQYHLFGMYDRTVNVGYSGSSMVMMNMIKSLMGISMTEPVKKCLVLMLLADYVPLWHSLPEVLVVVTSEYESSIGRYTLDQSPTEYLFKYIHGDVNYKIKDTSIDKKTLQKHIPAFDLSEFVQEITEKINFKIKLTKSKYGLNTFKLKLKRNKTYKMK